MSGTDDLLQSSDGRDEEVFSTFTEDEIGEFGLFALVFGVDADHLAFETASG